MFNPPQAGPPGQAGLPQNPHTVVCLSGRERGYGVIQTQTCRQRLIFIRRDFDSTTQINDTNQTCAAFVTGGQALQFGDSNVYGLNPPLLGFLAYGTTYISTQRLNELKRRVHQRGKAENFRHFQVIVSSLLYLHERNILPQNILTRSKDFFSKRHYRQTGTHVFMNYHGDIYIIVSYIDTTPVVPVQAPAQPPGQAPAQPLGQAPAQPPGQASAQQPGQAPPPPVDRYAYKGFSPISSIYPVMRYEWEEEPKQTICYGLLYDGYPDIYKSGDRYYHRKGDQKLRGGGVYELSPARFDIFKNVLPNLKIRSSIFYLCAGAKLVVMDPYGFNETDTEHDRALIQQGGIVICSGDLHISVPVLAQGNENKDDIDFKLYTMKEYFDEFLHSPMPQPPQSKPGDMGQPVIFLGPNESKYNSIAWNLSIQHSANRTLPRKIVLQVPMGGHIEAIENGVEGFNEIQSRINYEMLHDSVVTGHDTNFRKPSSLMAKKIINPGKLRSYKCYFVQDKQQVDTKQLPYEFNMVTPTVPLTGSFDIFLMTQNSRLAAPPMYPPVFQVNSRGGTNLCYIPSEEYQFANIDTDLYQYDPTSSKLIVKIQGKEHKYQRIDLQAYHYVRVVDPNQDFRLYHGQYHIASNAPVYRIGVDGWLWRRHSTQVIYQESQICLHYAAPPSPTMAQKLPRLQRDYDDPRGRRRSPSKELPTGNYPRGGHRGSRAIRGGQR